MFKKSIASLVSAAILVAGPGHMTLDAAAQTMRGNVTGVSVTPTIGTGLNSPVLSAPSFNNIPTLTPGALISPALTAAPSVAPAAIVRGAAANVSAINAAKPVALAPVMPAAAKAVRGAAANVSVIAVIASQDPKVGAAEKGAALNSLFENSMVSGYEAIEVLGQSAASAESGLSRSEVVSAKSPAAITSASLDKGAAAGEAGIVSLIKRAWNAFLGMLGIGVKKMETPAVMAQRIIDQLNAQKPVYNRKVQEASTLVESLKLQVEGETKKVAELELGITALLSDSDPTNDIMASGMINQQKTLNASIASTKEQIGLAELTLTGIKEERARFFSEREEMLAKVQSGLTKSAAADIQKQIAELKGGFQIGDLKDNMDKFEDAVNDTVADAKGTVDSVESNPDQILKKAKDSLKSQEIQDELAKRKAAIEQAKKDKAAAGGVMKDGGIGSIVLFLGLSAAALYFAEPIIALSLAANIRGGSLLLMSLGLGMAPIAITSAILGLSSYFGAKSSDKGAAGGAVSGDSLQGVFVGLAVTLINPFVAFVSIVVLGVITVLKNPSASANLENSARFNGASIGAGAVALFFLPFIGFSAPFYVAAAAALLAHGLSRIHKAIAAKKSTDDGKGQSGGLLLELGIGAGAIALLALVSKPFRSLLARAWNVFLGLFGMGVKKMETPEVMAQRIIDQLNAQKPVYNRKVQEASTLVEKLRLQIEKQEAQSAELDRSVTAILSDSDPLNDVMAESLLNQKKTVDASTVMTKEQFVISEKTLTSIKEERASFFSEREEMLAKIQAGLTKAKSAEIQKQIAEMRGGFQVGDLKDNMDKFEDAVNDTVADAKGTVDSVDSNPDQILKKAKDSLKSQEIQDELAKRKAAIEAAKRAKGAAGGDAGESRDLTTKEFGWLNAVGIAAAIGVGFLTHSLLLGLLGVYVAAIPVTWAYVAIRRALGDNIKKPKFSFAPRFTWGGKHGANDDKGAAGGDASQSKALGMFAKAIGVGFALISPWLSSTVFALLGLVAIAMAPAQGRWLGRQLAVIGLGTLALGALASLAVAKLGMTMGAFGVGVSFVAPALIALSIGAIATIRARQKDAGTIAAVASTPAGSSVMMPVPVASAPETSTQPSAPKTSFSLKPLFNLIARAWNAVLGILGMGVKKMETPEILAQRLIDQLNAAKPVYNNKVREASSLVEKLRQQIEREQNKIAEFDRTITAILSDSSAENDIQAAGLLNSQKTLEASVAASKEQLASSEKALENIKEERARFFAEREETLAKIQAGLTKAKAAEVTKQVAELKGGFQIGDIKDNMDRFDGAVNDTVADAKGTVDSVDSNPDQILKKAKDSLKSQEIQDELAKRKAAIEAAKKTK